MNTAKRTLLSAAIFFAAIAAFAQDQVTFKGAVTPLGPDHGPVRVQLSVDGRLQDLRVKTNGQFRFTVQKGQQVRMISSCEGHMVKEVVIDGAYASEGSADLRMVKFDVELEQQDDRTDLRHPVPAGNIAFTEGTGWLLVTCEARMAQQEPKLMAARQ